MPEDSYPITNSGRIEDQFRTANWLTGVMVTLLRQYFGSDDRISLDKGRFKWNRDATQSGAQIDLVDNLKYDEAGLAPKMLVDIENRNFPRDVLRDGADYQKEEGNMLFTNRQESAFTIECWGQFKLEALAIADEIFYFLQAYRHEIASKYGFGTLRIANIVKPVKYKIFKQYWIARIVVEFQTEERWGVSQESLRMSSFSLKLNAAEPPPLP